jgi:lipoyl(octanoyl) transferase
MLASKGVSVHEINRGGDVTYHGPGQLVGYPIFDLRSLFNVSGARLGPVDYVRRVEEALIRLCAGYGVLTGRVAGRTGVWTLRGRARAKGSAPSECTSRAASPRMDLH